MQSLVNSTVRSSLTIGKRFNFLGQDIVNSPLNFNMEAQIASNWCWAANTKSVCNYYQPTNNWTQCSIVCSQLHLNDCCQNPIPDECNVASVLDEPLRMVNVLNVKIDGTITFDQIKTEIQAGRVICARIGWYDGGGHFVAIYGYSESPQIQSLNIYDPINISTDGGVYSNNKSVYTIEDFTSSYEQKGQWTNTYLTQNNNSMFQQPLIDNIHVNSVSNFRPLLDLKETGGNDINLNEPFDISIPHNVYSLTLKEIIQNEPFDKSITSLRVIETGNNKNSIIVIYDLNPKTKKVKSAKLLNEFTQIYAKVLTNITNKYKENKDAEIRVLAVPGIYLEALWVHFLNNINDVFIPILSNEKFTLCQEYTKEEILKVAIEQANKQINVGSQMGS